MQLKAVFKTEKPKNRQKPDSPIYNSANSSIFQNTDDFLEDIVENTVEKALQAEKTKDYSSALSLYSSIVDSADKSQSHITKKAVLYYIAKLMLKTDKIYTAEKMFFSLLKNSPSISSVTQELEKCSKDPCYEPDSRLITDYYTSLLSMDYLTLITASRKDFKKSEEIFKRIINYIHPLNEFYDKNTSMFSALNQNEYFNFSSVYASRGFVFELRNKDPSTHYRAAYEYQISHKAEPSLFVLFKLALIEKNKKKAEQFKKSFIKNLLANYEFKYDFEEFKGTRNKVMEFSKLSNFMNRDMIFKIAKDKKNMKKEFSILKQLNSFLPEYTPKPFFTGIADDYGKKACLMLISRVKGDNIFDQLKQTAYTHEGKYSLILELTEITAEFHNAAKKIRTKKPSSNFYTKKIENLLINNNIAEKHEAKAIANEWKIVQKTLNKAPLDFYCDANLRNWSRQGNSINQYDFESLTALPCMIDLVSIVEFARVYLPKEQVNSIITGYYLKRKNLNLSKKEFFEFYSYSALQRHFELSCYRFRDFKTSSKELSPRYNELAYSFYHLESAIQKAKDLRLENIGNALKGLKKNMSFVCS